MNVNVHYGMDQTSKFFPGDSVSVGQVIANPTVKAQLGYGDNVRVLMDGVEVSSETTISDGDSLYVEVRANSKAAPQELLVAPEAAVCV